MCCGDVAVDEQRDSARHRRLHTVQAREKVEQSLVGGGSADQEPVFHRTDSFTLTGQAGHLRVEVGQMPSDQSAKVVSIGVDSIEWGAQRAEQPDPVQPVEAVAVVASSAGGIARRCQQTQFFVIAQSTFGNASASSDFADAPVSGWCARHADHAKTSRHVSSKPCRGGARPASVVANRARATAEAGQLRREVDQLRGEFEAAGRDLDQACARSWTRYANHGAGLASSHAFDAHRRCHGSLVGAGGHAG